MEVGTATGDGKEVGRERGGPKESSFCKEKRQPESV